MTNYHQYMASPQAYNYHVNDQRFVPGLGLGLGFLGGLATGALLTPGPGFGYAYPPYPYYPRPYPRPYPYPYFGYPSYPYYR
ncbi:hypothetical protein H1D32_20870 [Anaerobacillus sp. CMMVII]|uniref:hypothetical protein n=1 Tax=Anaerobacillus sp. CMMVII TaxID=2755588 RepID=UPI0021B79807|nr:hypothetical protein [Anaerobacillus sp. CMMVII]MCT8139934.1 hypothetical protein [Anaerobacillus sp. CMMVII]